MDILLSRLASVGLIVRAPSPEARPEIVDWRLFPDEEGVWARFWLFFEVERALGVFGSGSRGGGCKLFTLFARDCVVAVNVAFRGSSAPAVVGCMVVRREALVRLLVRVWPAFNAESAAALESGWLAFLPSIMEAMTPGPTDFRGCREPTLIGAGAGPDGGGPCGAVLCRRERSDRLLGCGGTIIPSVVPLLF